MRNHSAANARVTLEMQICFKNKKHIPTFPDPDSLPWRLCPRRAERDNPGVDAYRPSCLSLFIKLTTWAQGAPGEGIIQAATVKGRGEDTAPDHSKTATSDTALVTLFPHSTTDPSSPRPPPHTWAEVGTTTSLPSSPRSLISHLCIIRRYGPGPFQARSQGAVQPRREAHTKPVTTIHILKEGNQAQRHIQLTWST